MSMICYKGKVLTVDSNDTVAGYLVEDKGRIVYVGNELPEPVSYTHLTLPTKLEV